MPVRPGRNVAMIIEVAARNFRQKVLGYNAAYELNERIKRHIEINRNKKKIIKSETISNILFIGKNISILVDFIFNVYYTYSGMKV